MAISKTLTYADGNGRLRTTNVSIDVEKASVGNEGGGEKIFVVISAPGISSENYWRRELTTLVEDGIFATASGNETRYVHASGAYSAYGDRIINTGDGTIAGASGVMGMLQQLINLANA